MARKRKSAKKPERRKNKSARSHRLATDHESGDAFSNEETLTDPSEHDLDGLGSPPRSSLAPHIKQIDEELGGTVTKTRVRELLQRALSTPNRSTRIGLARQALAVDPNC
ncbi:MAG TPA: hypothetical protein EYP14_16245, partial [Planctomycetaceae bacterium]|nr:hypothetical protein [Planctomycetaceae bacterium]